MLCLFQTDTWLGNVLEKAMISKDATAFPIMFKTVYTPKGKYEIALDGRRHYAVTSVTKDQDSM